MRCIICDVRLELSRKLDICPECSDAVKQALESDLETTWNTLYKEPEDE
jgi:hypothetical protein